MDGQLYQVGKRDVLLLAVVMTVSRPGGRPDQHLHSSATCGMPNPIHTKLLFQPIAAARHAASSL
jgi:hypothetical protein